MSAVAAALRKKRDGGELSEGEIRDFLRLYVDEKVADYQASALLMAIYIHGMSEPELEAWTRAMIDTGKVLDLSGLAGRRVDKHSTGGVGDKVSIPLVPAVASCGGYVPMLSGRGLGHTGGTLDKLESIPGMRTELSEDDLRRIVAEYGGAFGAQTSDLAPADGLLYPLRDVTQLVESVPLIASSILSKKAAAGVEALVLDVKFGSGAFLPERERGETLARTMIRLGTGLGLETVAYRTSMESPLGRAVGHALEIRESLACLEGGGPSDLREVVVLFGGEMLRLAGVAESQEDGARRIATALDDGSARRRFAEIVEAQGGDPRALEGSAGVPVTDEIAVVVAEDSGVLAYADTRAVGLACVALGGGRAQLGDAIDDAVGVICQRSRGDRVDAGDPLFEVHHRAGRGLDEARRLLAGAVRFDASAAPEPRVLDRLAE